jgi:hypothetical protein
MGSRKGIPNKDKQAVRDLAAAHGVDVIEMRLILLKDCWKSIEHEIGKPRSRRSKHYLQAEEMANKHLTELTPYMHGKLSNINLEGQIEHATMVIRAPETIADNKAWLQKYGPKGDPAINEKPQLPFEKSLDKSLNAADALGINDPKKISEEAEKFADDDLAKRWNAKFLKG